MLCGTVKWFKHEHGFGFFHSHNGQDIFVHHSFFASQQPVQLEFKFR